MNPRQQLQAEAERKPRRRRVKKVRGHGGHHGGAWKVAYADFVTAMMALFLVLWLVSQADTKLKEAIANYFRSPGVFNSMRGGILDRGTRVSKEPTLQGEDQEALINAAAMLQKKFQKDREFDPIKDQVKIEIAEDGLRIQILDKAERVSFSTASAELTPSARAVLKEIATIVCGLPNPIFIGGHTDRYFFPAGSLYTNWELSADRANAARRFLEANCVKPEQIRRVIGYADTELLFPEDPYAPGNRRISITVSRMNLKAVTNRIGASPAGAGATDPAKRLNEKKLEGEGAVTIGAPDELPKGVKQTREP
ncbi:MAG: flagellar motor protein MotB [Blastocatellia bacterium]|nr:flagellar motor protein MotB [Blastocatellia bacterium]